MKIIVTNLTTSEVFIFNPVDEAQLRFGALLTFVREHVSDFRFILTYTAHSAKPNSKRIAKTITTQRQFEEAIERHANDGVLRVNLQSSEEATEIFQPPKAKYRKQDKGEEAAQSRSNVLTSSECSSFSKSESKNWNQIIEGKVDKYLGKKIDHIIETKIGHLVESRLSDNDQGDSRSSRKSNHNKEGFRNANTQARDSLNNDENVQQHFSNYYITSSSRQKNSLAFSSVRPLSSTKNHQCTTDGETIINSRNYLMDDCAEAAYQMMPSHGHRFLTQKYLQLPDSKQDSSAKKRVASIPSRITRHEGTISSPSYGHFKNYADKQPKIVVSRTSRSKSKGKHICQYGDKIAMPKVSVYNFYENPDSRWSSERLHFHAPQQPIPKKQFAFVQISRKKRSKSKERKKCKCMVDDYVHSDHQSKYQSSASARSNSNMNSQEDSPISFDNILTDDNISKISLQYKLDRDVTKDILMKNWHLSSAQIAEKLRSMQSSSKRIASSSPTTMQLGQQSKYPEGSTNILQGMTHTGSQSQNYSQFLRPNYKKKKQKNISQLAQRKPQSSEYYDQKESKSKRESHAPQNVKKMKKFESSISGICDELEEDLNESNFTEIANYLNKQPINPNPSYVPNPPYAASKQLDLQLSQSLLSMSSNLLDSEIKYPFRGKLSSQYTPKSSQNRSKASGSMHAQAKLGTPASSLELHSSGSSKKNGSSLDFSKKLQNTDDYIEQILLATERNNIKSIKQKGQIFLKMQQLFGEHNKSHFFRFIQQNQHLSESQIINKWRNQGFGPIQNYSANK